MADLHKADTVLIVDDDPAMRLLMRQALSHSDFHIVEAESGEEAITKFKTYFPALTLLDVTMPGMDGFECCRQLNKLHEDYQCAIVMVTGLDRPEDIEAAFDAGATDFMTKPLKWPLFNHRVRYLLKGNKTLRELNQNKNKLAKAQSIARLGTWEWDFKSPNVNCSDEFFHLLGFESSKVEVYFAKALQLIHPEERNLFKKALRAAISDKKPYDIEYRVIHPDGEIHTIHDRTELVKELDGWCIVGTLQDITNHKKSEQEIAYYAYYDTLTELPNRRLFIDQLKTAIAGANRRQEKLCLMFIDIDRFKYVNDTYGHHIGDDLLCQVADRIKNCVRLSDVLPADIKSDGSSQVARLAGDEFTVILCEVDTIDDVGAIARRLIKSFEATFLLKVHEVRISVSIGLAWYPDDGTNVQSLLQRADAAMYYAKEKGRNNYQFFSENMNNYLQKRLDVEFDLRLALERNELELYYQPQVDAVSENIIGYESLLRWNHPTKGLLGPIEFMEIAERSGLIIPIGNWVLMQACHQAKVWQQTFQKEFRMAVNLSTLQFTHSSLLQEVKQVLKLSGLEPNMLELEITETAIIEDISEATSLLFELKAIGVKLAIDDFGTGYSSLNYLKNFPIDTLKIDKSFIDEIVINTKDAAIAQTVVQLACNLGLSTIAEGVETKEQQTLLKEMGCTELQGYYYSKPLSVADIELLYQESSARG
ncbi:MAG: diguanylate cyclase (GGDEF)-like protein/PAS domain S-box-containing protein [Candidatus Endobugula sp.]|jgi:diguanylate cyclase (GGDEF)-like protein/PAS domain S-box-containing protein